MFYIITKKNCEMCAKALNYIRSKSITHKEINVDNTIIPPELMRTMEKILIDESTQTFASLKSFIRYKAPYFKERNIEPILLSKDEIRKIIISNPKDVLSFPIILMLGEDGITNYVVGFSTVVLDRWVAEPWTKGNFFNINRAYGDFYCCHECFEKEEKLFNAQNNFNFQNSNEMHKNNAPENNFKTQIDKFKNMNLGNFNKNINNSNFFEMHNNNLKKRQNSFENDRERIFGVEKEKRHLRLQNNNWNNQNQMNKNIHIDQEQLNWLAPNFQYDNRNSQNQQTPNFQYDNRNSQNQQTPNFQYDNRNSQNQQTPSFQYDNRNSQNQRTPSFQYDNGNYHQEQTHDSRTNNYDEQNAFNRQPIYIKENKIHVHDQNPMMYGNNKPRIYGETPILDKDKIINDLRESQRLTNSLENLDNAINFDNNEKVTMGRMPLEKISSTSPSIFKSISLGEEIGQPEFSTIDEKIMIHPRVEKSKVNSSNVNEFLDEISVILNNSEIDHKNLPIKKINNKIVKQLDDDYFSALEESNKKEKSQIAAIKAKIDLLYANEEESDFEDDNSYPFKKSIIDSLKNDELVLLDETESEPKIIFEQIKMIDEVRSNKPKLFYDTNKNFKIKDSKINLTWSGHENHDSKNKTNPLIEKINIDEKKYISSFKRKNDFEISKEEIYDTNRKLLEVNEVNYEIFTDFKNSDNSYGEAWTNTNNYSNKKGKSK